MEPNELRFLRRVARAESTHAPTVAKGSALERLLEAGLLARDEKTGVVTATDAGREALAQARNGEAV